MTIARTIRATFADWRTVKGRKQLQLIFEVPLEQQNEVLTMLGAPMPDNPVWCAVALLDMRKFNAEGSLPDDEEEAERTIHSDPPGGPLPPRRRAFCDLPFPQQAGILSNDVKFQLWMSKNPAAQWCDSAAEAIRTYCGVVSRADIQLGTYAGERWLELLREYEGVR